MGPLRPGTSVTRRRSCHVGRRHHLEDGAHYDSRRSGWMPWSCHTAPRSPICRYQYRRHCPQMAPPVYVCAACTANCMREEKPPWATPCCACQGRRHQPHDQAPAERPPSSAHLQAVSSYAAPVTKGAASSRRARTPSCASLAANTQHTLDRRHAVAQRRVSLIYRNIEVRPAHLGIGR